MHYRRAPRAAALASAFTFACAAQAQQAPETLPEIIVIATPAQASGDPHILLPSTLLSGDALRRRLGNSLGETLASEPGVSSSAFGAAASRPVVRGLGGPRVSIMQNGLGAGDLSALSEDHAVSAAPSTARQIEILRGPAALLYGSGTIGGLINIVNERIPERLEAQPTGEVELRHGTADESTSTSASVDASLAKLGLHLDAQVLRAGDYEIPGFAVRGDALPASGRLPNSFTRQHSGGFGMSHVDSWGHLGASVASLDQRYGIPSEEGGEIKQTQMRYDTDFLLKRPVAGIESARIRFAATDYAHTEYNRSGAPEVDFSNRSFESRWELTHAPWLGWRGVIGAQTEQGRVAAIAADPAEPTTLPRTRSRSQALFAVEERQFGPIRLDAGLRLESAERNPDAGRRRSFALHSYSVGGLWSFSPGYDAGATVSFAQRAPSVEELYSAGPHHATETFDRGNSDLEKERSRSIELTLQKTTGTVQWKANLFHSDVRSFIFGRLSGNTLDSAGNGGGDLKERLTAQADATLRGAEAEIAYRPRGDGWSARAFADTSRGTLNGAGSMPLQAATRAGLDLDHAQGAWKVGASMVHAYRQTRLAAFETATPAYTRVDARLEHWHRVGSQRITWFAYLHNLLDEDIRISTSVLKDRAPLPGRSLILGVRTVF